MSRAQMGDHRNSDDSEKVGISQDERALLSWHTIEECRVKARHMLRPIVKRRGIEIRAIWPDQRVNLRVDADLIEGRQVPQRPEKLSGEDRSKIDELHGVVVESHPQRVGGVDLE